MSDFEKLKERITLQTSLRLDDGHGGQIITWSDLKTVWAEMKPMPNKLQSTSYFGDEISEVHLNSYQVKVRSSVEVDRFMRIKWKEGYFRILTEPIKFLDQDRMEFVVRKIREN